MACLGSLLSPTPMLARTLVHYGLHFVFPLVIALLWPRRRRDGGVSPASIDYADRRRPPLGTPDL